MPTVKLLIILSSILFAIEAAAQVAAAATNKDGNRNENDDGCIYGQTDWLNASYDRPWLTTAYAKKFHRSHSATDSRFSILCFDVTFESIVRIPNATDILLENIRTATSVIHFNVNTFYGERYRRSVQSFAMINANLGTVSTIPYANLKYLNFRNNKITYLDWSEIFKLEFLESIDLSDNLLTAFDTSIGTFTTGGVSLKEILLDENFLRELPRRFFGQTVNLQYLSMASNRLVQLTDNVFVANVMLRKLVFSGNFIYAIPSGFFDNVEDLTILKLDHNYIDHLDGRVFASTPRLRELYLNRNRLTRLNSTILARQTDLRILSLAFNPLVDVAPDLFKSKTALTSLSLGGTSIRSVYFGGPYSLTNLRELDLSANANLTEIADDFFLKMPLLERLDLSQSGLVRVPISVGSLINLKTFNLIGTPLSCSCDNQWFTSWMADVRRRRRKQMANYHYRDPCSATTTTGTTGDLTLKPQLLRCAPVIAYITPKRNYPSDSTVSLRCTVYGNPNPTVVWENLQYPIEDENVSSPMADYDSTLKIDRLKSRDVGLYVCKATNEEGMAVAETEIGLAIGSWWLFLFDSSYAIDFIVYLFTITSALIGLQIFRTICRVAEQLNDHVYGNRFVAQEILDNYPDICSYFKPAMYLYLRYLQVKHLKYLDGIMRKARRKALKVYRNSIHLYRRNYTRFNNAVPNVLNHYMGYQLENTIAQLQRSCFKTMDTSTHKREKLFNALKRIKDKQDHQLFSDEEKIAIVSNPMMQQVLKWRANRTLSVTFTELEFDYHKDQTDKYLKQMKKVVREWCSVENSEDTLRELKVPKLVDTPAVRRLRERRRIANRQ